MSTYVVIPTYNEAKNVKSLLESVFSQIPKVGVMVVDDNSPDRTSEIVKELQKKFSDLQLLSRKKKEGLGKAYLAAFNILKEQKDIENIITMDGDFSHDPKYLKQMLEESQDNELVIGSRYIKEGGIEGWEFWRKTMSWCGNVYCRNILQKPVNDWTSGFNLIRADLLRKIDLSEVESSGYAFLIQLKYLLIKNGAKFKETPIVFKNRTGGESKISNHIIREGILAPWKLILKKK